MELFWQINGKLLNTGLVVTMQTRTTWVFLDQITVRFYVTWLKICCKWDSTGKYQKMSSHRTATHFIWHCTAQTNTCLHNFKSTAHLHGKRTFKHTKTVLEPVECEQTDDTTATDGFTEERRATHSTQLAACCCMTPMGYGILPWLATCQSSNRAAKQESCKTQWIKFNKPINKLI